MKKHICINCHKKLKNFYAVRCLKCNRKWQVGKNNPNFNNHKLAGRNHPNYIDGRKNKNYYCKACNQKISGYQSKHCLSCATKIRFKNLKNHPMFGKIISEESKRKNSLSHGGTGIPYENYDYPAKFKIIRKYILKRDNYECNICNKKAKIVHHIDYNKQNNKINNLITLCSRCHPKTNVNIDYWYAYFRYIIDKERN